MQLCCLHSCVTVLWNQGLQLARCYFPLPCPALPCPAALPCSILYFLPCPGTQPPWLSLPYGASICSSHHCLGLPSCRFALSKAAPALHIVSNILCSCVVNESCRENSQLFRDLASAARRRKATFKSKQNAAARYRSRPPFNTFNPDCFQQFVQHGLTQLQGHIQHPPPPLPRPTLPPPASPHPRIAQPELADCRVSSLAKHAWSRNKHITI